MKNRNPFLAVILAACLIALSACSFIKKDLPSDQINIIPSPTPVVAQSTKVVPVEPTQPTTSTEEESVFVEPLRMQSDSETIRLRILRSYTRWDSLWVDGYVDYYAAGGSNTPVQSVHTQVWVDQQTGRFRVLTGNQPDVVDHLFISNGATILDMDVASQSSQVYDVAPFSKAYYVAPEAITDTITPHPLEGMLGTPLGGMIFSSGLAQRGGTYQPVRMENYLGRDTLVVDWYRQPGIFVDRFWVDSDTGLILRWQSVGKGGEDAVESEMRIMAFAFGPSMPDSLFDQNITEPPVFAGNAGD